MQNKNNYNNNIGTHSTDSVILNILRSILTICTKFKTGHKILKL